MVDMTNMSHVYVFRRGKSCTRQLLNFTQHIEDGSSDLGLHVVELSDFVVLSKLKLGHSYLLKGQ